MPWALSKGFAHEVAIQRRTRISEALQGPRQMGIRSDAFSQELTDRRTCIFEA